MPYVERIEGKIVGLYANAQPGYAEEWLADDSPDVAAYTTAIEAIKAAEVAAEAAAKALDSAVKADTFVANFIAMTPADVEAYIQNNTANLADMRALLKKMGIMLLTLAKRKLR